MIFNYKGIDKSGQPAEGTVEAFNVDIAIKQLQTAGYVLSEIHAQDEEKSFKVPLLSLFNKVSNKDVVIMSRQIATLFSAQISALRVFRLLSGQASNPILAKYLSTIADDIQGGSAISIAIAKYPDTFSNFYVNMVKSGEESGKLDEVFNYLADYLDRTYEVSSKARSALIYPAFIIFTFFAVMILMLTVIIPKIALMITESGQDVPIYTKIVLMLSSVFINYGVFLAIGLVAFGFFVWKYSQTEEGSMYIDVLKLDVPYVGDLYRKLYLSRIADNMNTMIVSGIPILKALEITSTIVDNKLYSDILGDALNKVREGTSLSNAFAQHKDIPNILTQMVKVGEETGELGKILKSLANFYQREVTTAVDTLVALIEPIMIVMLGLGVGILLAAVLMPIYNIASAG